MNILLIALIYTVFGLIAVVITKHLTTYLEPPFLIDDKFKETEEYKNIMCFEYAYIFIFWPCFVIWGTVCGIFKGLGWVLYKVIG